MDETNKTYCGVGSVRRCVLAGLMTFMAASALALETILPEEVRKVPLIYCSDIFHPARDPDDHYDMAALFALKDFDVKAVILDGHIDRKDQDQFNGGGDVPLAQMCALSGYKVPSAVGLKQMLKDPLDKALDADPRCLAGVELMAKVLRESPVPVTIKISSGTDLAVLFNREPELCRKKIRAVYFNAGFGSGGACNEYNVKLDPVAYTRVFETGLNIYWNPCFGNGKWKIGDGHCSYFRVKDQREMLVRASAKLNRFFSYALLCPKADPMEWLETGPAAAVTKGPRNMWTPPVLAHAAGREVYRLQNGEDAWMTPRAAAKAGVANRKVTVYGYDRAKVSVVPDGRAQGALKVEYGAPDSNVNVFRQVSPSDFRASMISCTRTLYGEL